MSPKRLDDMSAIKGSPHDLFKIVHLPKSPRNQELSQTFVFKRGCVATYFRAWLLESCSNTAPKGNWCLEGSELAIRSGHRAEVGPILNKSSGDPSKTKTPYEFRMKGFSTSCRRWLLPSIARCCSLVSPRPQQLTPLPCGPGSTPPLNQGNPPCNLRPWATGPPAGVGGRLGPFLTA